jgi:ATP-binding cassette subfamily B protein
MSKTSTNSTKSHSASASASASASSSSSSSEKSKAIVASFPALARLGFARSKRTVPFVQQLEWTDCGAASLCMVMSYHGKQVKLAEVREAMGIGRDGVSAKSILDTAERYGLGGRGIKVDIS